MRERSVCKCRHAPIYRLCAETAVQSLSVGGWQQPGDVSSVLGGGCAGYGFDAKRRRATELRAGRALSVVGLEGQGVSARVVLAGAML